MGSPRLRRDDRLQTFTSADPALRSARNYPYCGKEIGYLGRAIASMFGARTHGCDHVLYR